MWWLQLIGVAAFAVLVGSAFVAWRRDGAPGTSRASMVGLFAVSAVLLIVGGYLVVATA